MPIRYKIADHIIEIIEDLQKAGHETYLVGGAVRDLLLGLKPKDYDISTSATPEGIRSIFGRRQVRIIGKRFRLAHYYHGHEIVEISTFRKKPEQPQLPHPQDPHHDKKTIFFENEFGTSYEDAFRRDFTVNAIFYDPVKNQIVDHCGQGMKDLDSGTIRTIGNPAERFTEDPVRILRALKLRGQYGFIIEPELEKALIEKMPLIRQCSASRLSLELDKIIRKTYSHSILKVLFEYGFLADFLPFLHENWNTPECKKMLRLMELRNSRIEKGLFRDSLSIAVAVAALPFVEKSLKTDEDLIFWKYFPGIEKEIKKNIQRVFYPHNFPKRVVFTAQAAILLQPILQNKARAVKLRHHPKIHHATELQMLWTEVMNHPKTDL